MAHQTCFFHINFAAVYHVKIKNMQFEVRAENEEYLMFRTVAHARDKVRLGLFKKIHFRSLFTVELGPDMNLPFVE